MAAIPDDVLVHRTAGPSGRTVNKLDLASAPLFLGTMLAEAVVLRRRARARPSAAEGTGSADATTPRPGPYDLPPDPLVPVGYERRDTVTSLTMLAGNVAVNLAAAGAIGTLNRVVFNHRIADVGKRRGSFAIALVAWDFLYYWDHRWMHEVRLFWANHVTHHSSQRYNLSTALRQPWSGFLLSWVYLPMPLLGIPAAQVMRAGQLNLLYQYWIHTEAIDRLPKPIEAVFNTPSHHRVPPRRRPAVPRPQLRRGADRVGQAVRHVRAGDPPGHLRADEEHRHVQPPAGRVPRVRRHRS